MKAPAPVIVVGLDACDPATALEFAAAGHMPVLAGLLVNIWQRKQEAMCAFQRAISSSERERS